jgi:hypothetical protein
VGGEPRPERSSKEVLVTTTAGPTEPPQPMDTGGGPAAASTAVVVVVILALVLIGILMALGYIWYKKNQKRDSEAHRKMTSVFPEPEDGADVEKAAEGTPFPPSSSAYLAPDGTVIVRGDLPARVSLTW